MSEHSSCLVKKLSHYMFLSQSDREQIAILERAERSYSAGQDIYRAGDTNTELFVVKTGWLISSTEMADGRRQIVKLHYPGDVIGFLDVAMTNATTTLTSIENVVLCPFPKSALDVILREAPRLSALLLSIALRHQVVLMDLLRATGRMSAQERVSYLILDLIARLRITNPNITDTFRMPLTQSQIGDYLGLTNVYVSKTLKQTERDGLLVRRHALIKVLDEAALIEQCEFVDRYVSMDTSWFPQGEVQ